MSFSLQLSRLVIGCGVVITFLFGLCSVFLASILSGKSSQKNFWSYRKNICARILNGFVRSIYSTMKSIFFCSFVHSSFYWSHFLWQLPGLLLLVLHFYHSMVYSMFTLSFVIIDMEQLEEVLWTVRHWHWNQDNMLLAFLSISSQWNQSTCTSIRWKTSTFQTCRYLSTGMWDLIFIIEYPFLFFSSSLIGIILVWVLSLQDHRFWLLSVW